MKRVVEAGWWVTGWHCAVVYCSAVSCVFSWVSYKLLVWWQCSRRHRQWHRYQLDSCVSLAHAHWCHRITSVHCLIPFEFSLYSTKNFGPLRFWLWKCVVGSCDFQKNSGRLFDLGRLSWYYDIILRLVVSIMNSSAQWSAHVTSLIGPWCWRRSLTISWTPSLSPWRRTEARPDVISDHSVVVCSVGSPPVTGRMWTLTSCPGMSNTNVVRSQSAERCCTNCLPSSTTSTSLSRPTKWSPLVTCAWQSWLLQDRRSLLQTTTSFVLYLFSTFII